MVTGECDESYIWKFSVQVTWDFIFRENYGCDEDSCSSAIPWLLLGWQGSSHEGWLVPEHSFRVNRWHSGIHISEQFWMTADDTANHDHLFDMFIVVMCVTHFALCICKNHNCFVLVEVACYATYSSDYLIK